MESTIAKVYVRDTAALYYVKLHSNGSSPSKGIKAGSSTVGLLRPEELMAYKIFELLGIGCECHFFGQDLRYFFIATLRAHHGGAAIREYQEFVKGEDILRRSLWGCLGPVYDQHSFDAKSAEQIEQNISADLTAQRFMEQMVLLDLLAHIMSLQDMQDIQGSQKNLRFGFVKVDGVYVLRVLDFTVIQRINFALNAQDFANFLARRPLCYASDKAMCYLFQDRLEHLRTKCARDVFTKYIMGDVGYTGFIQKAYDAVYKVLSQLSFANNDQTLMRLGIYKTGLLHAFSLFHKLVNVE